VKDLLNEALEGYKVTVFAYGNTSSGKTHTILGGSGGGGSSGSTSTTTSIVEGPDQGVLPRALDYLLSKAANNGGDGPSLKVW